jgi:activator of HSP90 ATPase
MQEELQDNLLTINLTQTCSVKLENCYQTNGAIIGTEFAGAVVGDCIYTDSVSGDVNISNCYSTNDTGTNKSSQNATVDNTLILSKSLLKKAAEDLGAYFAENTNSDLNDGYPVYAWELTTSAIMGDVNSDGEFSIADIVCLQRWLLADKRVVLNCWQNADFCKDDRINVFDLCLMKSALLKQK